MDQFLSQWNISTRIRAGFLLVLAALLIVAGISIFFFQQMQDNFAQHRELSRITIRIAELGQQITDLSRQVQVYTYSGHESLTETVLKQIANVQDQLEQIDIEALSSSEQELITRLRSHIQTYAETFELAQEERRIRRTLVRERIRELRTTISDSWAIEEAISDPLRQLQDRYQDVDRSLYQYLYDPQYVMVLDSLNALKTAQSETSGIDPELHQSLTEYRQTVMRIVQATRGYLFLIGVVMAGESQEFAYVINQLEQEMNQDQERISQTLAESSQRLQWLGTIVIGASILLAFLLSSTISRSISRPLEEITATFQGLARGDHGRDIPGTELKDEIGVLALAANVFQEKNMQTELLLADSRRLTDELEEKTADLTQTNQELDQFVYTVSHDLQSPIVTSMGFLGMIDKLVQRGDIDGALAKLPRVHAANQRMSELIADLLTLCRVGRTEIETELLDMNRLLGTVSSAFENRLSKEGVELEVAEGLPSIVGSSSRVMQVFENLISNAIKYGVDEKNRKIEICGEAVDNEARFFVQDYGPGISPEYHEKVFGLFQRMNEDVEGTGIGLAVVAKIMNFHGGRIWIESTGQNGGCRFCLAFPCERVTEEITDERQQATSINR